MYHFNKVASTLISNLSNTHACLLHTNNILTAMHKKYIEDLLGSYDNIYGIKNGIKAS
jgi:hypothetical protein